MNTIPQRAIVEAIPCRWKHLRGTGLAAVYRATCGATRGRGECRAHLGDLHHLCQRVVSDGDEDPSVREGRERAASQLGISMPVDFLRDECRNRQRYRNVPGKGWTLSGPPVPGRETAIYRGYADSGYRIVLRGKIARNGKRIGRRPSDSWERDFDQETRERPVDGRTPVPPTDHIWCPMCGTMNRVGWPDALQGCEAQ
jgi:hypothetical protein